MSYTESSFKRLPFNEDLVDLINRSNLKLLIIGKPPFFREGLYALCSKEWFRTKVSENCSPRLRERIKSEIKPIELFYKKLSMDKNVYFFDPFDHLCPKEMT